MSLTDNNNFIPIRKQKWAAPTDMAWALLASREISYGFLGTHGLSSENSMPYVVPMNFAVDPEHCEIYLHTTMDPDSKRNLSLAENPSVCFSAVHPGSSIRASQNGAPCGFSMSFISVTAFGSASEVSTPDDKRKILSLFMEQKTVPGSSHGEMPDANIARTKIFALKISHITCVVKE